jgi:hypothetical protein
VNKELKIIREAEGYVRQLNFYEQNGRYEVTPYNLQEILLLKGLPKFVYNQLSKQFKVKRKNQDKGHRLFLQVVASLFVKFGSAPFISSHKLHATLVILGLEISRRTVDGWLNKLVESGLISSNKTEVEKLSAIAQERKATIYTLKCPRFKNWITKQADKLDTESPNFVDGNRYKTNIRLAYRIAELPADQWEEMVAKIPGIRNPGSSKGEDRFKEMMSMVKCAAKKIATSPNRSNRGKKRESLLKFYPVIDSENETLSFYGKQEGTSITIKGNCVQQVSLDGFVSDTSELEIDAYISESVSPVIEALGVKETKLARLAYWAELKAA